MSEIKLVLTDFDGTVAELGKHIVSEKVREAVIACEARGIRVVPVTGRYHAIAQPVLEVLGFEDLGVFDNGASIMNAKTGEVIWSKWLEPAALQKVSTILAPTARIIDYTPNHEQHVPADKEPERIALISEPASHVYALIEKSKLDLISAELAEVPGITFYTAPSTRGDYPDHVGIQVNHANADKFHGVNALRDLIGIPVEQTLAIGDGDNDIALFKNANIKVAMGNATEVLKAAADFVVGTVAEDGFAEAMNRFVLQ